MRFCAFLIPHRRPLRLAVEKTPIFLLGGLDLDYTIDETNSVCCISAVTGPFE